ncbi:MAG TPA: hypothetical protein VKA27_11640 [Sunxiuqinia sp.]|nr:hypothetical protein [Sunxiuqinia sp.]
MSDFSSQCFVCQQPIAPEDSLKNKLLNLPVCKSCAGSEKEKAKEQALLEGLADDFVCGCI